MKDAKKTKKSMIPHKAQIPLALVLGILFIFLLNSRIRGVMAARGSTPSAMAEQIPVKETAKVSLSNPRIDSLIDKLNREGPGRSRNHFIPADMLADPFIEPELPGRGTLNVDGQSSQGAGSQNDNLEAHEYAQDERPRAEIIEGMVLQGTINDGGARYAIINGEMIAEKGSIGRFKVVNIQEGIALLEDDIGTVKVEMKGR